MMDLRCGRLDRHPAHDWTTPRLPFGGQHTYHCGGDIAIEGGHMAALDDCCYTCPGHDGPVCRDDESARSAAEQLCDACFDTEDDRTEAELLAAHDGAGFVSTEWAQIALNDAELGDWWGKGMESA